MELGDALPVLSTLTVAATLAIAGNALAAGPGTMHAPATHDAAAHNSAAHDVTAHDTTTSPPADTRGLAGSANAVAQTFRRIWHEGSWDIYVSGRAWHGSQSYSKRERERFNEQAWGAGFGKTLRDARGNEQSLFAFGLTDSNSQAQWMVGYVRQWIWPAADGGVEFGLGFSAMMMSRKDIFDRFPFPMAVPIASIGSKRVKLMATYVPPFARKGIGDVLLIFGRISFD